MKDRCFNPKCLRYKDYGGRGIFMCEEWKNSFESFMKWSMANGFEEKLTIDRIDVNKGYSPENCRWIPLSEQNDNKRTSRYITYQGKTLTIKEWAARTGIPYSRIKYRLNNGYSEYEIFEEKKTFKKYTYNGKTMTISEWSEYLNISKQTLYSRLKKHQNNYELVFKVEGE